jgi:hypothetical protein
VGFEELSTLGVGHPFDDDAVKGVMSWVRAVMEAKK